jgi:hypothetical protein
LSVEYLVSVTPVLRDGDVVVGDRWHYGYPVRPVSTGFAGPRWLTWWAVSLAPTADVIFNVAGPTSVILESQTELTRAEVETEQPLPGPVVTLDATKEPATLVADALEVIGR